jgi:hypothetical protein
MAAENAHLDAGGGGHRRSGKHRSGCESGRGKMMFHDVALPLSMIAMETANLDFSEAE